MLHLIDAVYLVASTCVLSLLSLQHSHNSIMFRVLKSVVCIDGFNYRAWHYNNYHVTKTGSHFVGQKGNQINRVSLVIQY